MGKSGSKIFRKKANSTNDLSWRRFGSVLSLRTKFKQHSQPPLPPLPTNAARLDRITSPSIENDVVNKDSSPTTRPSRKHLDIVDWLRALSLEQYEKLFEDYHGVEEIIDFSEADIKSLGVKISSHRAFIMSSLTALRNKYHGNTRKIMRHSLAVDNRNKIIEKERISHLKTVAETVQSKSLDNLKMHSPSGGCLDPNSSVSTPTQQSPLTPNHPTTPTPPSDPPASVASLKKVLEFELSLDSRDLRSHAWYHGNIPRSRADDLVREDGHFLVRDCTSQPGNYVLSGRRNQQPLHFVINRLLLQPDTVYERVQYHFEDEHYDTVPDLITAYVGSGRAITALSGARIQVPVNRSYPLSYYASRYQGYSSSSSRMSSSPSPTTPSPGGFKSPLQLYKTPSPTRCSMRGDNVGPPPPRLPSKKQRSHSLTPAEVNRMSQEKCNSADGVIQSQTMTRSSDSAVISNNNNKFSSQSLPRKPVGKLSISPSSITLGRANTITSNNSMGRVFSNHSLCGEDDFLHHQQQQHHHHHHQHQHQQRLHHHSADSPPPPPKPCRVSSLPPTRSESCKEDMFSVSEGGGASSGGSLNRVSSYHAASGGSDSGNGSGDSALSSATSGEQCCPSSAMEMMHIARCSSGVVIKNPRYNMTSSDSTSALRCTNYDFAAAESRLMSTHDEDLVEPLESTRFDLDNFQTILLPTGENKPLDAQTLHGVKLMLKESGSRILANHLTRCDLDLIFGELGDVKSGNGEDVKRRFGSGLELCTLPHGHQFRMDIIERTECMKLLVAVTILTCSNDEERVEILNRWIEVAIDTKTALGNLYGFCSIMLGLCLPQIQKLDTTWHHLRQTHTDHAFMFEAKLRPTLKAMNDCTNPQAPNTTVPHLLPYVLLMESGAGSAVETSGTTTVASTPPPQNNYSNSSVIAAQQQNNYSNEAAQCMEQLTVSSSQDLGLGMTLAHLDSARKFVEGARGYRRNADIVLGGDSGLGMMTAAARVEDLIGDLVRTEFQQKFLWGSKGALAASRDRHNKFALVLQALAEKYCAGTSTSNVPAVSLASPLIEGVAV